MKNMREITSKTLTTSNTCENVGKHSGNGSNGVFKKICNDQFPCTFTLVMIPETNTHDLFRILSTFLFRQRIALNNNNGDVMLVKTMTFQILLQLLPSPSSPCRLVLSGGEGTASLSQSGALIIKNISLILVVTAQVWVRAHCSVKMGI